MPRSGTLPPAPKKRRTGANRAKEAPTTISQFESVQFSDPSVMPYGSSHVATRSHLSTRCQRGDLGAAEPAVIFAPLYSKRENPEEVNNFMRLLDDRLEHAVPASLKSHLRAQQIGDPHGQHNDARPGEAELWDRVREIQEEATKIMGYHGDKDAWTEVVRRLLELTLDQRGALFQTTNIKSVSIAPPSLIPFYAGQPFAFRKVDYAIIVSNANQEVQKLYRAIKKRHPLIHLSQSDDESVRRFCQLAAIVMTSPDGSYYSVSVKIAIWLAAGLERVRQLQELALIPNGGDDGTGDVGTSDAATELPGVASLLPYPGITVVGHAWFLHLAIKKADGTVVIYSPRNIGDTTNQSGIFSIIAALEIIRSWGEEVYYPWLRDHILMPLAGKTVSVPDQGKTAAASGFASGVGKRKERA